jgi:hypothetical protein
MRKLNVTLPITLRLKPDLLLTEEEFETENIFFRIFPLSRGTQGVERRVYSLCCTSTRKSNFIIFGISVQ